MRWPKTKPYSGNLLARILAPSCRFSGALGDRSWQEGRKPKQQLGLVGLLALIADTSRRRYEEN